MKNYTTGKDFLEKNYKLIDKLNDNNDLVINIYQCKFDDCFITDKFLAIHSVFRTIINNYSLDLLKNEIKTKNKKNSWN